MVRWPVTIGLLAALNRKIGKPERAGELIRELGAGRVYGAPIGLAYVDLMLSSDLNSAAQWLGRAVEQRHSLLMRYVFIPLTDALRSSSHWPALAKMNLPASPPITTNQL